MKSYEHCCELRIGPKPTGVFEKIVSKFSRHSELEKFNWFNLRSGCLECLQICYENRHTIKRPIWDGNLLRFFIEEGHFECLKWAVERGCPGDIRTLNSCISHDCLDALQYLVEKGYTMDTSHTMRAAASGNLRILKWLHEHGCPWDESTTAFAAGWVRKDHPKGNWTASIVVPKSMDCLEYAYNHGCPLGPAAYGRAAACVDETGWNEPQSQPAIEVLEWLYARNCPMGTDATMYAAAFGKLTGLKWLHEHGCPWNETATLHASDNNNYDCLEYLLDHGCPIDLEKSIKAAENRQCMESHRILIDKFMFAPNLLQSLKKSNYSGLTQQIDFDDPVYRKFMDVYHDKFPAHPYLQPYRLLKERIKDKQEQLAALLEKTKEVLVNILPIDIILHIIAPYF